MSQIDASTCTSSPPILPKRPISLLKGDILLKLSNRSGVVHNVIKAAQTFGAASRHGSTKVHAAIVVDDYGQSMVEVSGKGISALLLQPDLHNNLPPTPLRELKWDETDHVWFNDERWIVYRLSTYFDIFLQRHARLNSNRIDIIQKVTTYLFNKINALYTEIPSGEELMKNTELCEMVTQMHSIFHATPFCSTPKKLSLCASDYVEMVKSAPLFYLRELAADMASYLAGQVGKFNKEAKPTGTYSIFGAFKSIIGTRFRSRSITPEQIFSLQNQLQKMELTSNFFCSHLVIYAYGLASLMMKPLDVDHPTFFPIDKNISKTSPAELFLYLENNKHLWTRVIGKFTQEEIKDVQLSKDDIDNDDEPICVRWHLDQSENHSTIATPAADTNSINTSTTTISTSITATASTSPAESDTSTVTSTPPAAAAATPIIITSSTTTSTSTSILTTPSSIRSPKRGADTLETETDAKKPCITQFTCTSSPAAIEEKQFK